MARSRSSATSRAQQDSDQHDNSDMEKKTTEPWDGTPLKKPKFYTSGRRTLMDHVYDARLFIETGTKVNDRSGKIAVYTVAHAQDVIDGSITPGTVEPFAPFDHKVHYATAVARDVTVTPPAPAGGGPAPAPYTFRPTTPRSARSVGRVRDLLSGGHGFDSRGGRSGGG